jgi:hypothetical protein
MGNCTEKCKNADGSIDQTAVVAALDEKYASAVAAAGPAAELAKQKTAEIIEILSPRARAAAEVATERVREASRQMYDMLSPRTKERVDRGSIELATAIELSKAAAAMGRLSKSAESSGLSIEFKSEKGETKTVVFEKKPLGMTISEKHPGCCDGTPTQLVAGKVPSGSYAFSLGVKAGWQITKMNGEAIPAGMSYDTFSQQLKEAVAAANLEGYRRTSLSGA